MEKVIIIIPTYNEAAIIAETIHQVFQATHHINNKSVEILIFDSASTDGTEKLVQKLQKYNPKLHLQTEKCKSGLGSAYLQAMRYAVNILHADIVIEFDADLSHQPKYIAEMLAYIDSYDVVVGSRYVKGGAIPENWGWYRVLLSSLGNLIARIFLSPKYKDLTSGFRVTRRELLLKVLPKESFISSDYAYKLQLFWALHKTQAKIFEFPIKFIDRSVGYSKLPANSIIDSLRVLFLLRWYEVKEYVHMCMVGLSGVLIQCIVYNILRHSLTPFASAGFAVTAAIVNNFTLNHYFTFKNRRLGMRLKKLPAMSFFIAYSIAMIFFQSYWLKFWTQYFGNGYIKENAFMVAGLLIGSIINYVIYTQLIWQHYKALPSNKKE